MRNLNQEIESLMTLIFSLFGAHDLSFLHLSASFFFLRRSACQLEYPSIWDLDTVGTNHIPHQWRLWRPPCDFYRFLGEGQWDKGLGNVRLMLSCLSKLLPVSSFEFPRAPPCGLQLFAPCPALPCVNRRSKQTTSAKHLGEIKLVNRRYYSVVISVKILICGH